MKRREFRRLQRYFIYIQSANLKPSQEFFGSYFAVKKELVFGSLPKERTRD
jgi:hypothetical protein